MLTAMLAPATSALMSMVIPARVRGLGMQTFKPWALLGGLAVVLVYHFAEMVQQFPRHPAAHQRPNSNWQERKTHVSTLLS